MISHDAEPSTTREAITLALRSQQPLTSAEIVVAVENMGHDVHRSTIRNTLYEMANDGDVDKHGTRGSEHIYKLYEVGE